MCWVLVNFCGAGLTVTSSQQLNVHHLLTHLPFLRSACLSLLSAISQASGCCWSPLDDGVSGPWCFYKAGDTPTSCFVMNNSTSRFSLQLQNEEIGVEKNQLETIKSENLSSSNGLQAQLGDIK